MSSEGKSNSGSGNEEVVLCSRPVGLPVESDWSVLQVVPVQLKEGEILLKAHYISVDPYLRGRIREHPIGTSYYYYYLIPCIVIMIIIIIIRVVVVFGGSAVVVF